MDNFGLDMLTVETLGRYGDELRTLAGKMKRDTMHLPGDKALKLENQVLIDRLTAQSEHAALLYRQALEKLLNAMADRVKVQPTEENMPDWHKGIHEIVFDFDAIGEAPKVYISAHGVDMMEVFEEPNPTVTHPSNDDAHWKPGPIAWNILKALELYSDPV